MQAKTLLSQVISQMNPLIVVDTVTADGDNWILTSENTLWANIGERFTLATNLYEVVSHVKDVSITVMAIEHEVTPIATSFNLNTPTFLHGKYKAVLADISRADDRDILPFVWMVELQTRRQPAEIDSKIDTEGQVRLFFCNKTQWSEDTDWQYLEVIEPLQSFVDLFLQTLKANPRTGEIGVVDITNHAKVTTGDGSIKQEGETQVFDKELTGIEVLVELPIMINMNCDEVVPQGCEGVYIYNGDTYVETIASGNIYDISDIGSLLSVDFEISNTEPLTGEEVTFTAIGDTGDSYFWKFGGDDWVEGSAIQEHTFTTIGMNSVWLRVITLDASVEADGIGDKLKINVINAIAGWNLNTFLRSNGTTDYITIAASAHNIQTVSVWFKSRGNDGSYGYIFSNAVTVGANREGLAIDEGGGGNYGRIYYYNGTTTTTLYVLPSPTSLNNIVFTRNSTTGACQLFVNGASQYSGVISGISTNSIDIIGRLANSGNYSYWDLYGFTIWENHTAILSESVSLWDGGDGQDPSDVIASPVRDYQFIGVGATVIDYGSDAEDGVLVNYSIPSSWH